MLVTKVVYNEISEFEKSCKYSKIDDGKPFKDYSRKKGKQHVDWNYQLESNNDY